MGLLFYRVPPPVDIFELGVTTTESFEYEGNWSGTIQGGDSYPNAFTGFNSPSSSMSETFELSDGWT
jgi:hypothetical protein